MKKANEPEPSLDDEPTARCDVVAFQTFARRHEAHLHVVALHLAGDAELAGDLVQETLARALFHFGKLAQRSNGRAWLTTILTRLYLDQITHQKVVNRAAPQLVTLERVEIELDVTMLRVTDELLRDAVAALAPDLRQVVELRYMQQLSYQEIADRLGVPSTTVGTRVMRALEQLKAIYHSPGGEKP